MVILPRFASMKFANSRGLFPSSSAAQFRLQQTFNVGFSEGLKMTAIRMDLEAAGTLLKVHPNTIRARAKRGKVKYETDNSGKIWVWIDPDAASSSPTKKVPKNDLEGSIEVSKQDIVSVLEDHIESLKSENARLLATVTDLRSRLDQSDNDRRALTASILAMQPPPPLPEPPKKRSLFRWW